MSQMRIGMLGAHFVAHHEKLAIAPGDDVLRLERLGEARPAPARLELVERAEERLARDYLDVDARLMIVSVLVAGRRLRPLILGDPVLDRREPLLPLRINGV